MAKGLNKHTPDSDELLKRLNSNDSSGLDDFEKEALEGFDSLDNAELAKNLTDSLNKKIDKKYFQKEGGNKKGLMYLSLAAGLVLVVGLSIFFTNIMGDKKEMAMELAAPSEKIANEVAAPNDLAPPPAANEEKQEPRAEGSVAATGGDSKPATETLREATVTEVADAPGKAGRAKDQPTDDGLTSRKIVKEKKSENNPDANKTADSENGDDFKQVADKSKTSQGPTTVNNPASPSVVVADQKNKAKEEAELDANEKTPVETKASSTPAFANTKGGKDAAKKAEPKKEVRKKKASGESLGKEDAYTTDELAKSQTTANSQNAVGGVANNNSNNDGDESGYKHTTEYDSRVYSKPQDYIKTEISKSEMLKTNVKAFKAELTIDENGKVKDVKFLTTFVSCVACEKEMRKILLNMPGWKATPSKKAVKETVSYMDQ